jgi:hypothetical protein
MSQFNFPGAASTEVLVASQSAASTITGTGIDLRDYEGPVVIVQNGGAGTGTLDGKIQDSADNVTFADVSGLTFPQKSTTAATAAIAVQSKQVRRFIRYIGTIVTGPHLVSVTAVGVKKIV